MGKRVFQQTLFIRFCVGVWSRSFGIVWSRISRESARKSVPKETPKLFYTLIIYQQ